MMKFKQIIIPLLAFIFFACQDDDQQFGELTVPSNLNIQAEIVGADADNPNGDGSGEVIFSASAKDAISYAFVFNSNKKNAPSGSASFIFARQGVNTYLVTAIAYGKAGISTTETIEVDVLSLYEAPVELKTKLYNFDPENPDAPTSKTWRIKNEVPGHFGLGPVGGQIPSEFFGVGVDEKAGVGMYDDRYIFNSDGTFEFITNVNTDDNTGTVFGRIGLIDELNGSGGQVNGADVENLLFEDFQVTYSLIAPGGNETISLSGIGFIGYYTGGDHSYQIFDRSVPNELHIKTTDGNGEFDWWFIITSE